MCSKSSSKVVLPSSCSELFKCLDDGGFIEHYSRNNGLDSLDPKLKTLLKYDYDIQALKIGRPLNKCLIVMFGQSGSGKSTTINKLFEDDICQTNSSTSQTRHVTEYSKKLLVCSNYEEETPDIEARISFVDVPGTLDVNHSEEALNFARIKSYRENNDSLTSRSYIPTEFRRIVRERVYPNLILLVVSATDNRLIGVDSNFQKTLKSLSQLDLVDTEHLNLLVVVTYAFHFPPKVYSQRTMEFTRSIQEVVFNVLRIKMVKVVFVENCGEDHFKKPEEDDFYKLPDGQYSHLNVMKEMAQLFYSTGDKLGLLLSGWYFHSDCTDKNNPVRTDVIRDIITELSLQNHFKIIGITSKLTKLGVIPPKDGSGDTTTTPVYNFSSLGHGYCPVTETVKHHDLLEHLDLKEVEIDGRRFRIPKCLVQTFNNNGTKFLRQSYESKESYELHRSTEYGLELGINLFVKTIPEGRWINGNVKNKNEKIEYQTFNLSHETRLTSLKIPNVRNSLPRFLIEALENLPKEFYPGKNSHVFSDFFSRFGTHLIVEQSLGGEITYECKISGSNFNENFGIEVKNRLGVILDLILSGKADTETTGKAFETLGVQNEKLYIRGGMPSRQLLQRMSDLTPEFYSEWTQSIPQCPVELERGFKLFPYYEVSDGPTGRALALKAATLAYLENKLPQKEIIKRDLLAGKIVKDAQESVTNWAAWAAAVGGGSIIGAIILGLFFIAKSK